MAKEMATGRSLKFELNMKHFLVVVCNAETLAMQAEFRRLILKRTDGCPCADV
jgi:hypothetical protein